MYFYINISYEHYRKRTSNEDKKINETINQMSLLDKFDLVLKIIYSKSKCALLGLQSIDLCFFKLHS